MIWLQAQAWKVATAAAAMLSIGLSIALFMSALETRHLTAEKTKLELAVKDRDQDLAQAHTNVATLNATIDSQSATIRKQSELSAIALAEGHRRLAIANAETGKVNARLKIYLATPPKGATACEQVEDIDKRYLETLK